MHSTEQPFAASAGAQPHGHSSRKTEANRANAQKSTGPKSATGKARSSQNATRHGMLAATATLVAQPNREIETLLAKYRSEFRPTGVHEDMLVSELAVADWRIKQITRIETGVLWFQMEETYTSILNANRPIRWEEPQPIACGVCGTAPEPATPEESESEPPQLSETGDDMRTLLMGAAWVNNPASFALVVRYQSQARRDYFRALKQLGGCPHRQSRLSAGRTALPDRPTDRPGAQTTRERNEPNHRPRQGCCRRCLFERNEPNCHPAAGGMPRGHRRNEAKRPRLYLAMGHRPVRCSRS